MKTATKKNIEVILADIKECLSNDYNFMNGLLRDERLRSLFSRYLSYYGYIVLSPCKIVDIHNAEGLVRYFYNNLNYYKPDVGLRASINFKKDLALAKRFIQNRIEAIGQTEEAAIMDCAGIIKILFEYENEFELKYPVREFHVLSGDKLSWIISRAYKIMKHPERYEDTDYEEDTEKILAEYIEEFGETSFLDLVKEKK